MRHCNPCYVTAFSSIKNSCAYLILSQTIKNVQKTFQNAFLFWEVAKLFLNIGNHANTNANRYSFPSAMACFSGIRPSTQTGTKIKVPFS